MTELPAVRAAAPADLDSLVTLCAQHAAYERAVFLENGQRDRLEVALFGTEPRLLAWVAGPPQTLLGYATASIDFATWTARSYLHMDCLFVTQDARGRGLGGHLFQQVLVAARSRGLASIEWQTPDWNGDAQRFYERQGAQALTKQRYTLRL